MSNDKFNKAQWLTENGVDYTFDDLTGVPGVVRHEYYWYHDGKESGKHVAFTPYTPFEQQDFRKLLDYWNRTKEWRYSETPLYETPVKTVRKRTNKSQRRKHSKAQPGGLGGVR